MEYDGTNYHGWQTQENAVSIQETIERALSKVMCHPVQVIGAGRTDAGVHAFGQAANFFTMCSIPVEKIPYALNAILPDDIVIKSAEAVAEEFHARYSAQGKKYRYIINNSKLPSAINRLKEYFCPYNLDYESMRKALQLITGEHDFKGFMAAGSKVKDTFRTVYKAEMKEESGSRLVFELTGNGFLYNMVRIIVGTIIDLGRGRLSLKDVESILKEGDRKKAGQTVPPQGLYLVEVYY